MDDGNHAAGQPVNEDVAAQPYPEEVEVLDLDGRRIVLVGTAHVSQESVALVRAVIERERPDTVCVELDQRRFEALSQRKVWDGLDLREVIRKRQLATLMLNLLLASYQKRLGAKLGVVPGSELLEAIDAANQAGVPVVLCDRDVRATLRRAWASLGFRQKAMLISGVIASVGEAPDISEEDLRKLRQKDALSELMQELGRAMPELKRTLIDERDAYLAEKIRQAPGQTLVAVVGAGHLVGMAGALRTRDPVNLAELEMIPSPSRALSAVGWGFALLIVGSLAYVAKTQGMGAAGANALFFCLATGVPSAIGGILALAHPLTILSAFVTAPVTALSPVLGVGQIAALVQCYLVPPRVYEFQSVSTQLGEPLAWWRSRLLRVFLVFIFTSLGGAGGTLMGGSKLLASFFQ
jgi:pheromone shutdown-related protein TraB